ncbi:MAG: sulfotransferase [Halioglobus sp.]
MNAPHTFEQYLSIATAEQTLDKLTSQNEDAPLLVGAVGGSGSRLVVQILEKVGVTMAPYANRGRDTVLWPPLENLTASSAGRHSTRQAIISHALRGMEDLLQTYRLANNAQGPQGLKATDSFIWLPELANYFPTLRYIHITRNGLDMAYSKNQAQFRKNAWYFGINSRDKHDPASERVPPERMLDYWIAANRYAIDQGRSLLGDRFFLLDFDLLCQRPTSVISRLLSFLGAEQEQAPDLAALVEPPASIGRHLSFPWQQTFTPEQLDAVAKIGGL